MPQVEYGGVTFTVDEDGFIDDFNNYCPEWLQHVKKEEGIEELNDEHMKLVQVLRDYYEKNGIAPMVRVLSQLNICLLQYLQLLIALQFLTGQKRGVRWAILYIKTYARPIWNEVKCL